MKSLNVFIHNYRTATQGLNLFGRVIIAIVISFIFVAVIFAVVGVIKNAF
ncbi:MAG TPA: hypothetical protein VK941_13910 [Gillisia sp.]|nr:hypothetical protein [Gillisia sp.]